jgi:hypothetical protein
LVAFADEWDVSGKNAALMVTSKGLDCVLGSSLANDFGSQLRWQVEKAEGFLVCIPPLALSIQSRLGIEAREIVGVQSITLGLFLEIVNHEYPLVVQADLNLTSASASTHLAVAATAWKELELEDIGFRCAFPGGFVNLLADCDSEVHEMGVE